MIAFMRCSDTLRLDPPNFYSYCILLMFTVRDDAVNHRDHDLRYIYP